MITLLFACGQSKNNGKPTITFPDGTQISIMPDTTYKDHISDQYFVGDIDKDEIMDTAFVDFDVVVSIKKNIIDKKCLNKDCEIVIKFTNNIPDILINNSLGIRIEKCGDRNNEILIFSDCNVGYGALYLYRIINNKWTEIAKTKVYISGVDYYKNRIVKIDNEYYLVGDKKNETKYLGEAGFDLRSVKVKIK